MFDWIKQLFMPRWSGRCPLCGSSRVAIKIRRKMPYVVDGPTFAYYTFFARLLISSSALMSISDSPLQFAFQPKAGDLFCGQFVVKPLSVPSHGAPFDPMPSVEPSGKDAFQ